MNLFTESACTFSEDRVYRYTLTRRWDEQPLLAYVMLNPSTADEVKNDPTVERCERRARLAKWGGVVVLNLFAYRSTDPAALYTVEDPVGPENDRLIAVNVAQAGAVICAWGTHGKHRDRARRVVEIIKRAHLRAPWCLGINADGSPKHPLYVPYSEGLRRFDL